MDIKTKTIKFNLDKPEERELWEKLQRLPHGEFSEKTKEYWNDEVNETWKHTIQIGKHMSFEDIEEHLLDFLKQLKEEQK